MTQQTTINQDFITSSSFILGCIFVQNSMLKVSLVASTVNLRLPVQMQLETVGKTTGGNCCHVMVTLSTLQELIHLLVSPRLINRKITGDN